MSDTIVVALIGAIPAMCGFVMSLVNKKKINELHLSVNGRLTELLKLTAESSKAEGVKQATDKNGIR